MAGQKLKVKDKHTFQSVCISVAKLPAYPITILPFFLNDRTPILFQISSNLLPRTWT